MIYKSKQSRNLIPPQYTPRVGTQLKFERGTIGKRQQKSEFDDKLSSEFERSTPISKLKVAQNASAQRAAKHIKSDQGHAHVKVVRGLIPGSQGPQPRVQKLEMIDQHEHLISKMEKYLIQRRNEFAGGLGSSGDMDENGANELKRKGRNRNQGGKS